MPNLTIVRDNPGLELPGSYSTLTADDAAEDLLRFSRTEHSRFGTGWSVDDTCGMVGSGELALWVARSGCGKSTAYLNVIRNTPLVPTLVVNMEMTPRRQIEWLLSMTFDLKTKSRDIEEVLRFGEEDDRYTEIVSGLGNLNEYYPHLHFVSPSRPTVSDLKYVVQDITDATGVRPVRIFIDHLTLMGGAEDYHGTIRTTSGLHSWAMRDDLAITALQQSPRGNGDQGRNDGHVPVTLSSGLYGGDADADWVFGMYRPDRNPRFRKSRWDFRNQEDYFQMLADRERVLGISVVQVVKNRTFGDTLEDGIELRFNRHNRRLEELGMFTHG